MVQLLTGSIFDTPLPFDEILKTIKQQKNIRREGNIFIVFGYVEVSPFTQKILILGNRIPNIKEVNELFKNLKVGKKITKIGETFYVS